MTSSRYRAQLLAALGGLLVAGLIAWLAAYHLLSTDACRNCLFPPDVLWLLAPLPNWLLASLGGLVAMGATGWLGEILLAYRSVWTKKYDLLIAFLATVVLSSCAAYAFYIKAYVRQYSLHVQQHKYDDSIQDLRHMIGAGPLPEPHPSDLSVVIVALVVGMLFTALLIGSLEGITRKLAFLRPPLVTLAEIYRQQRRDIRAALIGRVLRNHHRRDDNY